MKPTLKERLSASPNLLADLQTRKITNAQAAKELGVNANYLSNVMSGVLKHKKDKGKVSEKRENVHKLMQSRRQMRMNHAKRVAAGEKTLVEAAKSAKCSERTMRRYVNLVSSPTE